MPGPSRSWPPMPARGVTVRVVLDHRLEAAQNQPAFSYLSAHGVQVRWAPGSFPAFHIKMFCIDSSVCSVLTLNFTSRYYANTRDFAVTDPNPSDVAAMEATFTADFDGTSTTPSGRRRSDLEPGQLSWADHSHRLGHLRAARLQRGDE